MFQKKKLEMYLLLSANYRKNEYDTCASLADKRDPDGSLIYPNMQSNAEFWDDMDKFINGLLSKIYTR